ncbi:rna recognition domain-containing protein [Colletotrichum incanum]|uniref:Rna recognition domain-containing protein n=1 Tax=Colletotrichum incanum TaxID=1573173 RepID=A0A162NRN7_COLIC|nr:rna recognition domain-containing protein [Colletotrichum incanum]
MVSAPPVLALEAALKAIPDHRAPGITGTRIAAMTSICVENVQYESALVQKLFTYFMMATPPYKLGFLYVVDSVVRKWLVQARSRQQVCDENAADGTCGAGVHRLTVLMPNFIDDLLRALPDGHKDKLHKLIGIWRKASTFPNEMIKSFQSKLEAMPAPVPSPNPARFPLPLAQFQGLPTTIQFSDQPRIPQLPRQVAGVSPNTAQQMAMFRIAPSQGTTADRFAVMLTSVSGSHNGAAPVVSTAPTASSLSIPPAPAIAAAPNYYISGQRHGGSAQPNGSLNQHGYDNRARSPSRHQGPTRSRWPSHRDSRRKRRGSKHRQRILPPSRDGSRSNGSRYGSNDKRVEFDRSLPAGHIKGLSRTLLSNSMQPR